MHSNVMHRFMVQAFQDPPLCNCTVRNRNCLDLPGCLDLQEAAGWSSTQEMIRSRSRVLITPCLQPSNCVFPHPCPLSSEKYYNGKFDSRVRWYRAYVLYMYEKIVVNNSPPSINIMFFFTLIFNLVFFVSPCACQDFLEAK